MLELLMNEKLGVTDNVDEENVTNFEFDVRHLRAKPALSIAARSAG
jgi:hypothetical protein